MTEIQQNIIACVKAGPIGASALSENLKVSRQTIHKNTKILLLQGVIIKQGIGPHVVYALPIATDSESRISESLTFFTNELLPWYKEKFARKIKTGYEHFHDKTLSLESSTDFTFMRDSSVLYSSRIEGNTLDLNSYLNSKNLQKKNKPKEVQEIDDLALAYEQAEGLRLTEKNLLTLHRLIGKEFMSPARRGVYRSEPVGVFSAKGIEYLATEPSLVQGEMALFFTELKKLCTQKLSGEEVFLFASWVHLMFALIHPFSDGNGRTARLLEKWFLAQHLGDEAFYLPSEEWYFKNRTEYYNALKLGVNYWEADFKNAKGFVTLFSKILDQE